MTAQNLPPGPRSAWQQLLHLKDPFPLMDRLAREHADPMTCPLIGQPPMVLVWSPEHVRAVMGAPPGAFSSGASDALSVIIGEGSLFLQSGEEHRRARKLLMPPFHGERMKAYETLVTEVSEQWLARIEPGRTQPMLATTQAIALDVIVRAIFGVAEPERTATLRSAIADVVAAFNPIIATFRAAQRSFWGFGPWARFQRKVGRLRALVDELIAEKRTAPGEDILSLLLSVRDDDGVGLSGREIYDQLLSFVIAGHETTATTLAWAMYELARHPEALERLRSELAGADAGSTTPYAGAAIDETLRRHPPVPIVPRRCADAFELGGYVLPRGQSIGVAAYLAHHREARFDDPFAFRPERFLEGSPSPFEYLPFGGGPRRCLGAAFARFELRIALSTIVRGARFALSEPGPVGNAFRIGTYGPSTGVRMVRLSD